MSVVDAVLERAVPVLYVDIDGTIRWGFDELGRFVNDADDVRIFDGVPMLLARYKRAGWRIVGVSNQGGIALGHVTSASVEAAMKRTHALTGGVFDKLAWCGHHPDAEDPEFARCWCRKPRPGLALEAAFEMALLTQRAGKPEFYPPHLALFVGDRPEDEACAAALNVDFMWAAEWRAGGHVLPCVHHYTMMVGGMKCEKCGDELVP